MGSVQHLCLACDALLVKKPGPGRWPKTCSPACKLSTYRVERRATACATCGQEFAASSQQRFCSAECRRYAHNRRPDVIVTSRARVRANYASRCTVAFAVCRYCNALFCARSPRATICYSTPCQLQFNRERLAPINAQRRAAKRDPSAERFDPVAVFDRDGWICGICELSVDPAVKWPDPGSASLDHIIPLAHGGKHTRANTQCAHLYCNNVKGARVAA